MSRFTKAQRKKAKAKVALAGPAGSGKTYSAIQMARGLVGPDGTIAMIDTERGSGDLYSHLTDYSSCSLEPPYTPRRYRELIEEAAKDFDCIIIDSLSHAWAGEGGALEMVDKAAKSSRSGNSYMAWGDVTPEQNKLVDAILSAGCHLIVTLRTKTAYEIQKNNKGKSVPVKIGLKPVQRDGIEYEFTVVLEISVDSHMATSTKDRTGLFDGEHFVPGVDTGDKLRKWLVGGVDVAPPAAVEEPAAKPVQEKSGGVSTPSPTHFPAWGFPQDGKPIAGADRGVLELYITEARSKATTGGKHVKEDAMKFGPVFKAALEAMA